MLLTTNTMKHNIVLLYDLEIKIAKFDLVITNQLIHQFSVHTDFFSYDYSTNFITEIKSRNS